MLINHQYHTWIRRTWELRPGQGITQARNLVWLLIRINRSRSVTLSRIGARFYGEAKLKGTVQRLERFLANTSIRVRDLYVPISKQWLEAQFHHL